jgi:hypothetical protein
LEEKMALVHQLTKKSIDRNSVHDRISATYTVFDRDGEKYIQIYSYGSEDRKIPGKKSQTLQFDEAGARTLFEALKVEFGFQ